MRPPPRVRAPAIGLRLRSSARRDDLVGIDLATPCWRATAKKQAMARMMVTAIGPIALSSRSMSVIPEHDRGGDARGGQREHPAGDDPARDGPVDLRARPADAGAGDGAGDDVGRGEREAEVRGGEDHDGGDLLRGEALRRAHLGDLGAERLDDPPAAHVGAERDRQPAGEDDPVGHVEVGRGEVAVGDQREARSRPSSSARRWCRARARPSRRTRPAPSGSRAPPARRRSCWISR